MSNAPLSEQFRLASFEARFIPEPNSGCWLWLGMEQAGNGYGFFCYQQVTSRAHRASWEIYRGQIPDGAHVLHKCDNRLCVNPDHLFLGTHKENMADRNRKGRARGPIGEDAPQAKLTADKVREIRRLKEQGYTAWALAGIYEITRSQVWKIVTRKVWKHV